MQLIRTVAENIQELDLSDTFYQNMVESMVLQNKITRMREGITNDELAENLIERAYKNDLFISSGSKLDYMAEIIENPSLKKHIEDENFYETAMGHMAKMLSDGFQPMLDGGVMQTIPDLNTTDTKLRYDPKTNTIEIIAPPSMGKPGDVLVGVRIPTNAPNSTFTAKIASNGPADMSVVVMPQGWYTRSNADNDGDQVHLFKRPTFGNNNMDLLATGEAMAKRQEVYANPESTAQDKLNVEVLVEEAKLLEARQRFFDAMKESMTTEHYRKQMDIPLDVEPTKQELIELGREQDMDLQPIGTLKGTVINNQSVALGKGGIGPVANEKKAMSFLAENDISLFDYKGAPRNIDVAIDGKTYSLNKFSADNVNMLGNLLQSVLDQISHNMMPAMGITAHNISEYVTMAGLSEGGVNGKAIPRKELLKFWDPKEPVIAAFNKGIAEEVGVFGDVSFLTKYDKLGVLNDILKSYDTKPQAEREAATAKIETLKSLIYESDHIQKITEILKLDKGVKHDFSKLIRISESFRDFREQAKAYEENKRRAVGWTPGQQMEARDSNKFVTMQSYLSLLETPLFKHYESYVNKAMRDFGEITLKHSPAVLNTFRQRVSEELGRNSILSSDVKNIDNVIRKMLDHGVLSANYVVDPNNPASMVETAKFIQQAGDFLFDLKNTSEELASNKESAKEYTPEEITDNIRTLELYEADKINLPPEMVQEYNLLREREAVADFVSGGLRANEFWKSLRVSKGEKGVKLFFDEGMVDQANRAQMDGLKESFEQLPKSLREFVTDYMIIGQGSANITNNSIWSALDNARQMRRYRLAGELIDLGPDALKGYADNAFNHDRFTESMMLNMRNSIRTVNENRLNTPFTKARPTAARSILPAIAKSISETFPISYKALDISVENNDLYMMNTDRSMLSEKNKLPRLVKIYRDGKEMIMLKVYQKELEPGEYVKALDGYYLDITKQYNEAEGVVHPLVLERPGSPSSKPPVKTLEETISTIQSDLDAAANAFTGNPNRTLGNQLEVLSNIPLISSDKARYDRIVRHLKETWGDVISVENWETYGQGFTADGKPLKAVEGAGGQADVATNAEGVIQRIVGWAVNSGARLDRPPHEYAHHLIDMFPNAPHIVEGIKKFGSVEKFVQAVGEQYVQSLGGNNLERAFREYSYKLRAAAEKKAMDGLVFWSFANEVFGSPEVQEIVAEGLITGVDLNKVEKPSSDNFLGNYHAPDLNSQLMEGKATTGADSRRMGNSEEVDVPMIDEETGGADLAKKIGSLAKRTEYQGVLMNGESFEPGIGTEREVREVLRDVMHNIKVQANKLIKDKSIGVGDDIDTAVITRGQLDMIENMMSPIIGETSSGELRKRFESGGGNSTRPLRNHDNVGVALTWALLNPNQPIPTNIGETYGINQAEKEFAFRAAQGLVHANRMIMSTKANADLILTSNGKGMKAADVAKEVVSFFLDNQDKLSGSVKHKKGAKKLAYDVLHNDAIGLQAKIFKLWPDRRSPVYEVMMGQMNKSLIREADIKRGTSENPGMGYIIDNAIARVSKEVRYSGKRGSVADLKDVQTLRDQSGNDWKLSVGEMLGIYQLAQYNDPLINVSYRDVLLDKGVVFDRKRSPDFPETLTFTPTEASLQQVDDFINTYEGGLLVEINAEMIAARERGMDQINPTYLHAYGIDFPYYDVEGWLPTYNGHQAKHNAKSMDPSKPQSIGGFDQARNPYLNYNETLPLQLRDSFEMHERLVGSMASFHAYHIPIHNLRNFYNATAVYDYTDENGVTRPVPNGTIDTFMGSQGVTPYWEGIKERLAQALNQGLRDNENLVYDDTGRKNIRAGKKAADVIGNYLHDARTTYALGAKLSTAAFQTLSVMYASTHIQKRHLARGLASSIAHREQTYNEVMAHSPLLGVRLNQATIDPTIDMAFGEGGMKQALDDTWWTKQKKKTMVPIRYMDATAILAIWEAAKLATQTNHSSTPVGSPEYWEHVDSFASEVVLETQPTADMFHRNDYQMDPNHWKRHLFLFGSQLVKMHDQLSMASSQQDFARTKAEKSRARKNFWGQAAQFAVGMLAVSALGVLFSDAEKLARGEQIYEPDRYPLIGSEGSKIAFHKGIEIASKVPGRMFGIMPGVGGFVSGIMEYIARPWLWHESQAEREQAALVYGSGVVDIPLNVAIEKAPKAVKGLAKEDKTVKEWFKTALDISDVVSLAVGSPAAFVGWAETAFRQFFPYKEVQADDTTPVSLDAGEVYSTKNRRVDKPE